MASASTLKHYTDPGNPIYFRLCFFCFAVL